MVDRWLRLTQTQASWVLLLVFLYLRHLAVMNEIFGWGNLLNY